MTDREAFEAAIEEDKYNELRRSIYADWLEEHDLPEEGQRQRNWVPAYNWLATFSVEHYRGYTDEMITIATEFVEHDLTEDLDTNGAIEMAFEDQETRRAFWKNWEVVTGKTAKDRDGRPFRYEWDDGNDGYSCSC